MFENRDRLISLQVEKKDALKEALYSIKFLAVKPRQDPPLVLPKKVFLVYTFFNNKSTQTKTAKPYSTASTKVNYLVIDGAESLKSLKLEQILDRTICDQFHVEAHDHLSFVSYLNQHEMQIDVWDAETLVVYASGKLNMQSSLRQGKATQVVATDIELREPRSNKFIGQLQVVLTNEGRQAPIE